MPLNQKADAKTIKYIIQSQFMIGLGQQYMCLSIYVHTYMYFSNLDSWPVMFIYALSTYFDDLFSKTELY